MNENTRKMLSLLMAMAMLFSMLPMGVTAQAQGVENAPAVETVEPEELAPVTGVVSGTTDNSQEGVMTLTQGESVVTITEADAYVDCTFVPSQTGMYIFCSVSEQDTVAYLYDAEGNELAYNDDGGNRNNFMICWNMTAGTTYTLRVKFYGDSTTGSITVRAEYFPLVSVSLSPVSVIEGTNGSLETNWNDGDNFGKRYFVYSLNDIARRSVITATFADGTVVTGAEGYIEYNGRQYSVSEVTTDGENAQNYENQWTRGNTYTASASFMGLSAELEITVLPSPLESITFTPVTIVENTCGYIDSYWDPETQESVPFFRYSIWDIMSKTQFTATFTDGTTQTGMGGSNLQWEDRYYSFAGETDQSVDNLWVVGNTYYADVQIMGMNAKVPVTIIPSPLSGVESFTFAPVRIMEGTHGSWNHGWNPETQSYSNSYYYYEHYQILNLSEYTIQFDDGTVLTGTGDSFVYQGETYYFETYCTQNHDTPWLAGDSYNLTVRVEQLETQIPVTITASALESITVAPVEIIEGEHCYLRNNWNPETGENEEFNCYDLWHIIDNTTYTATFTDGTVVTGTGSQLSYNGNAWEIHYWENQTYNNQWTVGNTYEVRVYLLGREAVLPVSIISSPLESLTFTPVELVEQTGGNWYSYWNPETQTHENYYHYEFWSILQKTTYTATFRDGTVLTGTAADGLTYKGEQLSFEGYFEQSFENQWTLGNTYYVDISILGQTAQVPVTITALPLASLTFEPVTIMEKTNGQQMTDTYYYYNPYSIANISKYTATFMDGTVRTGWNEGFEYNGQHYRFEFTTEQCPEQPWLPGNTYYVDATVGGHEAKIPVTITASPLESITFTPITVIEGTCGNMSSDWDAETQTNVSYFYYQPWDMASKIQYTANFTDGTTQSGRVSEGLVWDDNGYSFSFFTNQSLENQWTVGNTYYIEVSIMGQTAQVPVTIVPSPVVSITVTSVTIKENRNGHMSSFWIDGIEYSYFRYNWYNKAQYTVTMNDGSVFTGNCNSGFYYQDEWYGISSSDNQSWNNQWTVGNTYTTTVSILGATAQTSVTIVPTVKQVISLGENDVNIEEPGDEQDTLFTPTESGQYIFCAKSQYHEDTYAELYDENGNELTSDDDSGGNGSFKISWDLTAGKTYTLRVRYYSSSRVGTIKVVVKEYPVQRVVFNPIIVEANVDGYWSNDWETGNKFFEYNWADKLSYTVNFKDGTAKQGTGYSGVEHDGMSFDIYTWSDNQSVDMPWLEDNTYLAQVRFDGKWYDVYVSVCRKTEDNGFTYFVQDGKAIINGCTMQTEILQIPETIDGYPVVGITSLGEGLEYALEVRIPDCVTALSGNFLRTPNGWILPLKKLMVGSGIASLSPAMLERARNLECIEIAEDNPYLCSIDGVVYNKAVTALVAYPPAKTDLHVMPDSVTDANILFDLEFPYTEIYASVNIQLGAGIKEYKMVDGIIYDPEMTTVIKATAAATGSYVMPESVTDIEPFAFAGSNLTAVSVSPNVVSIVYTMFYGHTKLEEITIPVGVREIDMRGPLDSLQKVHITDLEYWCNSIWFDSNPLEIAHDLYLNGEKIVDLVLPETVAEGVYSRNRINSLAFAGASFESVTIPSRIADIGHNAFADCENLKKVYITDLGAWSGTMFGNERANPLYYARDLYLNGEKITDLVLPETVVDRIYSGYFGEVIGVNNYAFINANIETVTVPEKLQVIGYYAFEGCENLNKVNISDLTAWCRIEFASPTSNPLFYARDLYLNGEKITDLVLPNLATDSENVTDMVYGIGNYTFYNIDIESLTVPSYVYTIGNGAFYGSSVERITFEEGITDIGPSAFECSNLKALELPDSLMSIDFLAFLGCRDLETVSFGSGLEVIYDAAFADSGVKSIELPDSLGYLGSEVFADCRNLTQIDFGSGVMEIPYRGFVNSGLTSVTLPKQITYVGSGAFENSALTEVIFDCEAVEISNSAFANCPLGDLDLGDNITMVYAEAFSGTNATQIKLPSSVTEISYRVYAFNKNLVSVTVPDTITYIDGSAFDGCEKLSHVLYTGTQDEWYNMENYSEELWNATLHCEAIGNEVTTSQTCTTVTFYCSICDKTETVRKGKMSHSFDENGICTICGEGENYWEYEENGDGTVTIIGYTGQDTELVVPERIEGLQVTAFTKDVFAYNRNLILVELPAGITEIPAEAFAYCASLRMVTMGDAVTAIGDKAFYSCNWLREVELPDSVTTIGAEAFVGASLNNFRLPKSLTTIGEMAFRDCYMWVECLEIPAGVTEIVYGAFADCRGIEGIIIPDTVTAIGYYAFAGTGITNLTIPASVKDISAHAFTDNRIRNLVFLGDQPNMQGAFDEIGISAFYTGANKTWNSLPEDNNSWYACNVPTITRQPVSETVAPGETITLSAEAYGQRLSYQWYYAAPGTKKFVPVGGDSIELTMTVDRNTAQGRVYCLVTDLLGQTAKTNTVTLRNPAEATGIRLAQLPYTREYDMRQELRTRGLEVMLTFNDGSEESITDYIVTGYDANLGGVQTITVTYGDYSATFNVTVNEEKLNFSNDQEKIEISAPEGAVESNVELVVEKVYEETQLPEMPEMPEIIQENNAVIFDITLEQDGEPVQPEQTVQVSIPVPVHMESKRCKVFHIADDGTVTDMNAQYKDGRMVFDTDHFSYYAVVEVTGVTITGTVRGASDLAGTEVKLLSGGEVLETVSVSKNGTYRFDNVVPNDYEIEATQSGLPTKKMSMTVSDQDVIVDILMAILGDIDGNEQVTRDDVIRLLLHVTMPNRFPLDAEADFNGDTQVTRDDVIRLLLHVTMPNRFPLE